MKPQHVHLQLNEKAFFAGGWGCETQITTQFFAGIKKALGKTAGKHVTKKGSSGKAAITIPTSTISTFVWNVECSAPEFIVVLLPFMTKSHSPN